MVSTLSNLKKALRAYNNPHLHQESDRDQELLAALIDLKDKSNPLYTCDIETITNQSSFHLFYSQLRRIFNFVYRKKNKQVDPVILKFHSLLKDFSIILRSSMDMKGLISDYQYDILKTEILGEFPKIKTGLYEKQIPYLLIFEIQAAIDCQFNSLNSNLRYHHYIFLQRLIRELACIAQDTSNKDWTKHFMETMIDINLNHTGFFERCRDLIDSQLNNLSIKNQLDEIEMTLFRLRCASRDPKLHYNLMLAPLPDRLTEYLELRKTITKNFLSIGDGNAPEAIEVQDTFNNKETLALLNHMFQASNEDGKYNKIDIKNFFSLLKFFNGPEPSEEQILELKNKSYKEKQDLTRQLKLILAEIEKDESSFLRAPKNKR